MSNFTEKQIKDFLYRCHDIDNDRTLKGFFELSTTAYPKNTAVMYFDENGKKRSYDYKTYREKSFEFGRAISKSMKEIEDGSLVAIKIKNCPSWAHILWGVLMNNHPVLLIDAKLNHQNTQNLLNQAHAKAIVCDEEEGYEAPSFTIDSLFAEGEDLSFTPNWADEISFCSSGTTGEAKIMVYDGKAITGQIVNAEKLYESSTLMHPGAIRIIAMLPFHHIFGFFAVFLWFSYFGKCIVYPASTGVNDLLYAAKKGKVTHFFSVPLFWDSLAQKIERNAQNQPEKKKFMIEKTIQYSIGEISSDEKGRVPTKAVQKKIQKSTLGRNIEFAISGGGFISAKTMRIINGIGYPLYDGYGMTEVAVTSVETSPETKDRLKCSVGRSMAYAEYEIRDEKGNALSNTEIGELYIKTEAMHTREIIGGIESPTPLDEKGFYASGDYALIDEDGRMYLKGRKKDVIIGANGENIYPDEIESYFNELPHLKNLCVFGVGNMSSTGIVLVIEVDKEASTGDIAFLKSEITRINSTLPGEKKVTDIYLSKKPLPLSSSMKVKRNELRDSLDSDPTSFTSLGNKKKIISFDGFDKKEVEQTKKAVKALFARDLALKEDEIGDNDSWASDLGGDSMVYVSMVSELEDEFGITMPKELYGELLSVSEFTYETLVLLKEKTKDVQK